MRGYISNGLERNSLYRKNQEDEPLKKDNSPWELIVNLLHICIYRLIYLLFTISILHMYINEPTWSHLFWWHIPFGWLIFMLLTCFVSLLSCYSIRIRFRNKKFIEWQYFPNHLSGSAIHFLFSIWMPMGIEYEQTLSL